jgi:hypothetical protein
MQEIPKPELLDPDRVDRDDREDMSAEDHRSQAKLLAKALEESCGYATQLWEQLDEVRGYLLASLPPDPRMPGPKDTASASPTGPDDEEGWQRWITTFASTTSALCGAHGDSGFGLSRAKEEAQVRRSAPIMALRHRYPQQPESAAQPEPQVTATTTSTARQSDKWGKVKLVGAVITAALAIRGLRRPTSSR